MRYLDRLPSPTPLASLPKAMFSAALLFVASPLSASVPLDSFQVIRSGNSSTIVTVGDLDGDGAPDLAGVGGGNLYYAINGGDASSWILSNLTSNPAARHIELEDLDGDDDLDLIYTSWQNDAVYWFENDFDGSGGFGPRRNVATVRGANGVAAGDLDGDLDLDLVVAGRKNNTYYWIENANGDGSSWVRNTLASGLTGPQVVALADLDQDDDLDVVAGGSESQGKLVWFENTAGDGTAWTTHELDEAWIGSIQVVDLDFDGDPDIVVQENNASPVDTKDQFVWFENTSGDASTWTEHEVGSTGRDSNKGLQVADLDFDQDFEIFGSRNGDWWENTVGDASAWTSHSFSDNDDIADTDLADLDGDGDLDIIGGFQENDRMGWWENLTCSLSDSDDDADGYRNNCDVCDGFDDGDDADDDGVPDGCDQCPGEDDRIDVDGNDIPDACQVTGTLAISDVTESEGDSGSTSFNFQVTLTGDVAETFTVDFTSQDGTATTTAGDYTAASGTLNFDGNDGEVEVLTISVSGDMDFENDEEFSVVLSNLSTLFAILGDDTALGTIQNDDLVPLSIDDVSVSEGDNGTVDLTFDVTLNGTLGSAFTVDFATQDGTATTAGNDYTAASGTLNFDGNDGDTQSITVTASGDTVVEGDETFTVVLSSPSSVDVEVSDTGTGTLQNDDSATLAIDDVSLAEGESGTTDFTFSVTLTGEVQDGFTVEASTQDGTATHAAGDFSASTQMLTFVGTDGEVQTFTVSVAGDTLLEDNESFTAVLGTPSNSNVTTSDDTGLGTIQNDDQASIAIDDVTVSEGDFGTTDFTFSVTLTGGVQDGFSVGVGAQDGTATDASDDYTNSSATLSFDGTDGEIETFTISVQGDAVVESDETFSTVLGSPSKTGVIVSDDTGTGTIQNDDSASIAVDDFTTSEGDSGTTDFTFSVTLTGEVQDGFTVDISTQDGTATVASNDYATAAETLSFDGTDGEVETFTISVAGDEIVEADETFSVVLAAPSLSSVSRADDTGVGTVENDDSATLAIDDVSLAEGDSGTTDFTFSVTLTGEVQDGFTVEASTQDGTATHAAGDFSASTQMLTFVGTDGEVQTFTVSVAGDTLLEDTESFTVVLGTPSNSSVTASEDTGLGTIQNDDSASIAIDDVAAIEGNSGTSDYTFTVTLTGDVQDGFTVALSTQDRTATVADGDYSAAATTLSFAGTDGETETFTVSVTGDTALEGDDFFAVVLGIPSNSEVARTVDTGIGTIQNDDTATLSISDVTAVEGGDSETTNFTFSVTLTGGAADGFTVGYATSDGTASSVERDYTTAIGLLTFDGTDGEVETFNVNVFGDSLVEEDETFIVSLSSPSNAFVLLTDGSGLGTIQNDDSASVSIADFSANEGDSGTTEFHFAVTLSGGVSSSFLVAYGTQDGSATVADGDYQNDAGFLTFAGTDGETQNITLLVNGDTVVEGNEDFFVHLGSVSNASVVIGESMGQGTIQNDDASLTITVEGQGSVTSSPAGIDCGESGTDCDAIFTIGTSMTLTPVPATDWLFAGWSGDTDCANTFTLTDSTSCTANFIRSGGLLIVGFEEDGFGVVTSSPAGVSCDRADASTGCTANFDIGVAITLSASVTSVDTTFDGWTGDADCSDGVVTFTADGEAIRCQAILTVTPLFADGFESGDTSGWSALIP